MCFGTCISLFSHILLHVRLFVYTPIMEKVLNTFAAYNRMTTSSTERICQSKVPNGVQDVEMPHPPTNLVGVASGDRTETAVANSTDETTYAVVDRTKKASGCHCGMVLV